MNERGSDLEENRAATFETDYYEVGSLALATSGRGGVSRLFPRAFGGSPSVLANEATQHTHGLAGFADLVREGGQLEATV